MTAYQLAGGAGADLYQHDCITLISLNGDLAAFIVPPRRYLVSRAQKQARDQEIVTHPAAHRGALKLSIAETRLDGDPHKPGHWITGKV